MIIHTCPQYSPEWVELRLGKPTASQFHRIVTRGGKKGPQASSQQWGYLTELLSEKITGHPEEQFTSNAMEDGHDREGEAVSYYEFQTGSQTQAIGFVTDDAARYGASPDRAVLPALKRGVEIKCPEKRSKHLSALLNEGEAADEHFIQCQAQIYVCEFEAVDLVSYFYGMPTAIFEVLPDWNYIEAMDKILQEFLAELDRLTEVCIQRGYIKPRSKAETTQAFSQLDAIQAVREAMVEINK